MRLIQKQIILLSILMFSGCTQYEAAVEKLGRLEPDTFTCDVVRVKSAATFLCRFPDLEIDTIRLAGITIPEDRSTQARRFSEAVLIIGLLVRIEPDEESGVGNGGIPAYVYVPGGKMLNTLLLEKGYAEVVRDEVNVKYKAVFINIEDNNRGEETEKKPWIK